MTIVLAMALIAFTSSRLLANDIYITQSGNGLDLNITQDGKDNSIEWLNLSELPVIIKIQDINFNNYDFYTNNVIYTPKIIFGMLVSFMTFEYFSIEQVLFILNK